MKLTPLDTGNGPVYVDLDQIAFIRWAETKLGHAESRMLGLRGSGFVYISNSVENAVRLAGLLPDHEPSLASKAPVVAQSDEKPKRGRKPKP